MKKMNLIVGGVFSVALALALPVQAGEHMAEKVDQNSLPQPVQKTIKDKAAGGEVKSVMREDDKNGKWNYEIVVDSKGKEWGFEVDPNGKYVKKHDDHTNTDR